MYQKYINFENTIALHQIGQFCMFFCINKIEMLINIRQNLCTGYEKYQHQFNWNSNTHLFYNSIDSIKKIKIIEMKISAKYF